MNMGVRKPSRVVFPGAEEIPESARIAVLEQQEYLSGGRLERWEGSSTDVHSPIRIRGEDGHLTPMRLGSIPALTGEQSLKVLEAAERAYDKGRGLWPTLSVAERIAHVEDFAFRMRGLRSEIVRMLLWEIGKSLRDSEREFDRTLEYIRGTIEALKDLDRASSRFTIQEGIAAQIRRGPLGVVLCMGPFNYPLNETFTILIPALIMGNTVVMKPPKLGTLLFRPLLEAFRDAFPPGVVNTIYGHGPEIVPPLIATGRVDVLAFIGTSRVADQLKLAHPRPHRLRSVLGLDAKNPAIVLEDVDLDLAVRECILGALSFNGQRCTAVKIIFVPRGIADSFLDRLSSAIGELRSGMPWEDGVFLTPLPEPGKPEYLSGLIADAERHGARVVNEDGGRIEESYVHPAVVHPVNDRMRLYHEEQFGPVIPVVPYDSVDEAIRFIVESPFGSQVSLFGSDPAAVGRLIDPLVNQVCRVNLNSQCQRGPDTFPFTGRKDSAEGTLSVSDALRVFSIRTLVAAKHEPLNQRILESILREHGSRFLSTDFIF
jgi:glyceraldehyde-3-phosphate dehydrogenase (NADP+)